MSDDLVLEADTARLVVSATDGGRMRSLVVHGQELLVTTGYGPTMWGCYPFVPFAGRIRDGRFTFESRDVELPLNLPPNAIHGTVLERAWTIDGPDCLSIDLGPPWPFAGRVSQWFTLRDGGLDVRLRLDVFDRMPVVLGWHPWFRRQLIGTEDRPSVAGEPVELRFQPGRMYERGADGLPTGRLVPPKPRPWDDCFVEVERSPRLTWPGGAQPGAVVSGRPLGRVRRAGPRAVRRAPDRSTGRRPPRSEDGRRGRRGDRDDDGVALVAAGSGARAG